MTCFALIWSRVTGCFTLRNRTELANRFHNVENVDMLPAAYFLMLFYPHFMQQTIADCASKGVPQTQQQRPESPNVTLTWHARWYKVHKLRQSRYINSTRLCTLQVDTRYINSTRLCTLQVDTRYINSTRLCTLQVDTRYINSTRLCTLQVDTRYINSTRVCTLVEFMYLVFTRMPGESYRRRLRSLLLRLCDILPALINSLACGFCTSALDLALFETAIVYWVEFELFGVQP